MRIIHSVIPGHRLTRVPNWGRGAVGVGALTVLLVAALSAPAGADGAQTTTTTTGSSSVTTTTTAATAAGTSGATTTTTTTTGAGGAKTTSGSSSGTGPYHQTVLSTSSDAEHANTTPAPISGTGSSFASPAIDTWVNATHNAPYDLSLNWASSNSGQGRYEFTNQTTDFAVSDIGYVGNTDTTPPSFPFNFIPITAGGIAFMYNVPGLSKQLQLSSYSACGLLTGGIKSWNDPAIAADNPGVSLPNLPVVPVTESDSAGTNFVLEEWCIDEQPALWQAFVSAQESQSGGPTDGVAISPTSPNSNWPGIKGGLDETSTTSVASDVASNQGGIGAVQVKYAQDSGFDGSDPTKNVALVKNASGDYTPPTPVDVASALAYATQLPNGTHQLNFSGQGPHVYNPSTYSYLLTPTTGWSPSKGDTMSQFVNYVLTLGQQTAPTFGYASLGLSLEQYGVNAVQKNVPGAVAPTAAEQQAYSCGDLTPTEVQAGQTTPTCGVTLATAGPPGANAGTATGSAAASTTKGTAAGGAAGSHTVSTGSGTSSSGSGGGIDPSVALTGTSSMAGTGMNAIPLTVIGLSLLLIGFVGRRRVLKRRAT
ncbi:MAG: substrate-binding domain-containing protein [Acidimicrobiales bacterium]|jgi:ABC-type phosphate transport system substrate-binding protein